MLKYAPLLLLLVAGFAIAGGTWPSVNADMGCTAAGQAITYNGSTITCDAPQRPTTVIGSLPTCNTAAQGKMYFVTDALAPVALSAVASGGSIKIGVMCNAVSWVVQ